MRVPQARRLTSRCIISVRGGAVTRALRGEDLPSIMERAFWKRPSTARRYMKIMEVVPPGAVGNALVKGVSVEQYRQINEFPLSE